MNDHISTALRLTPVIERVHGVHHPELTRVRELTEQIAGANDTAEIDELFRELRGITHNFALPKGACEAFTATYTALQAADEQYAIAQAEATQGVTDVQNRST